MQEADFLTSVFVSLPGRVQALEHVVMEVSALLMPETIDAAVCNDCRYVVRMFGATRKWTAKAMDGAAALGRLDIVDRLYNEEKLRCTAAAMEGAATNGHIEVVRWLQQFGTKLYTTKGLTGAARNGHYVVVEQFVNTGHTFEYDQPFLAAAINGHHDVLEHLATTRLFQRSHCSKAMEIAAAAGNLKALKAMHKYCIPYRLSDVLSICTRPSIDNEFVGEALHTRRF